VDLTSQNVQTILKDCLFTTEEANNPEILKKAVLVEGVTLKFGFHPERLNKHKDNIIKLLKQLPTEFDVSTGGGWSFLYACTRLDGVQWGEHRSVDELLILGIAIKKAKILMPRDCWSMFPGGVPYFATEVRS